MGATFSPKIALECFHAPAGWIFFTAKAVGLFLLSQCIKYFSNEHVVKDMHSDDVELSTNLSIGKIKRHFS
jgi:hypothetical protein